MKHLTLLLLVLMGLQFDSAFGQSEMPDYSSYILTPPPAAEPRINSARVFGVRPGAPILYTIAASGERPLTFAADGLPEGVVLDRKTGRLTGSVAAAGTYRITMRASNAKGSDERILRLEVGERIALTPPMGWNSWNCWGNSVSQEKVLSSARALVDKGLADYGWTYVNIDDGWQGRRGGELNAIQPNAKFPDMKALADDLHNMGLKLGIYSGPWVGTYAGHAGTHSDTADGTYPWIEEGWSTEYGRMLKSDDPKRLVRRKYYRHGEYSWAEADARQWAEWGVDYLKYDWKPNDVYYTREMHDALLAAGRDIVYSLSNTAPFADAFAFADLAQCWRTTGDIRDTWESVSSIGFLPQERWAAFSGPGHWPDADMLVVGMVGWGPNLHPTRLTPDEQYTHITLWTLMASPMLIGGDISQMDDFTRSLLCNCEVNDVLQDPLGMRAMPFQRDGNHTIYVKILEDGSLAVGLFNLTEEPLAIEFEPRAFGLWSDPAMVRDIWRQKDVAYVYPGDTYKTEVAPHGTVFLRLSPGNTKERRLVTTHYSDRPASAPVPVKK